MDTASIGESEKEGFASRGNNHFHAHTFLANVQFRVWFLLWSRPSLTQKGHLSQISGHCTIASAEELGARVLAPHATFENLVIRGKPYRLAGPYFPHLWTIIYIFLHLHYIYICKYYNLHIYYTYINKINSNDGTQWSNLGKTIKKSPYPVFLAWFYWMYSAQSSSTSAWSWEKMVAMDADLLQVFIMFSSVRKCEVMEFSTYFPLINYNYQ